MIALAAQQSELQSVQRRQRARRKLIDPDYQYPAQPAITSGPSLADDEGGVPDKGHVVNYVQAEETIRNDYCAWYGISGEIGGGFVLGAEDHEICEE
jgi:hypothetical protein